MKKIQNIKSKSIRFNLATGLSPELESTKRLLSAMEGMYLNNERLKEMIREEDTIVYEFYDLEIPEHPEELAYGTTIVYPGKVDNEFFMTKGHFHSKLDTAEIYYCIKGHGYLLMENPEGEVELQEMSSGISVYVPPRYAHRSINISNTEPFITFFTFRADAGHDYKTIETRGFRKLVVERHGKPELIDNPKWNSESGD